MVKLEVTGSSVRRVGSTVLLVALAAIFVWGMVALVDAARSGNGAVSVDDDAVTNFVGKGGYQVVILANDRVYFGHLRARAGGWYELRDAYFIRQKQGAASSDKSAASQQVAPIGEELTEPEPNMLLRGDQIVQVQNLKKDSRVADAIDSLRR